MDELKPSGVSRPVSCESGASKYTDDMSSFEDDEDDDEDDEDEIFELGVYKYTDDMSSFEDDEDDEDDGEDDDDDEDEIFDSEDICNGPFVTLEEQSEAVMNSLLYRDMENLIAIYSEKSVQYRLFESIGEIDVELHIPLRFLDDVTADAWNVLRTEPLVVKFYFSLSNYLKSSYRPKVEVFQPWKKEKGFGFCSQVRQFLESFLQNKWHHLHEDYQTCLEAEEKMKKSQSAPVNIKPDEAIWKLVNLGFEAELAPAVAVPEDLNMIPLSTLDGKNAKHIPSIADGFLVQVFRYVRQRIPTMNEYCVICDEPLAFQNGAMLRLGVCSRELCVFSFQTLGGIDEAAENIARRAEVVDLLINMTRAASKSGRKNSVLDPFPAVVDPNIPCNLQFTPKNPDYNLVESVIDAIPPMSEMSCMTSLLRHYLDGRNPSVYPLIQWIITSNRSHIVKLPPEKQLDFMYTPHQFLLLSSPPAKEVAFRDAKRKHGSTFAFHGSSIENWHSIIRQGLMKAPVTQFEVNGTVYGEGIYLSPCVSTSMGYSRMGYGSYNVKINKAKGDGRSRFLVSSNVKCVALCEVITTTPKKNNSMWVCPEPDHVCTRFLFVYEDGQVGYPSIDTQNAKYLQPIKKACDLCCTRWINTKIPYNSLY